ncbi:GH3 auxin-responsive promoter [Corchorus olitorius]|uniref:GH3 auxin-responsive promoter n=1 Tax=Corchorus olitorius TaxID=93759 RepID=A0A1R3IWW4_9ROSI|nr:GH3 auxin-responsive promoter [Corchorus olitorius]
MASNQMETKEHEDGWQKLEELTMNAHQVQEKLFEKILKRSAGTEYLRGFLNGQADKNVFREKVPIGTYEDIKPYIDRIVNGEPSDILLADPILEFMQRKYCATSSRHFQSSDRFKTNGLDLVPGIITFSASLCS